MNCCSVKAVRWAAQPGPCSEADEPLALGLHVDCPFTAAGCVTPASTSVQAIATIPDMTGPRGSDMMRSRRMSFTSVAMYATRKTPSVMASVRFIHLAMVASLCNGVSSPTSVTRSPPSAHAIRISEAVHSEKAVRKIGGKLRHVKTAPKIGT